MKKKRNGIIAIIALCYIAFLPLMVNAQACPKKSNKGCGLEKKLSCKISVVLMNQALLGLSGEQIKKIKDIKIATKKDMILRKAEIALVGVDIKSKLCEGKIDKESTGKLIDKKYDLKKEKMKALMGAYADFKNVLTDEQKSKLKEIKCQNPRCCGKSHGTPDGKPACQQQCPRKPMAHNPAFK